MPNPKTDVSLSAGNTNSISASLYYSGQTRWCHPKVLQKGIALFQSVCVFFSGCSNSINLNSHTSWVLLLEYMEVSPNNRMDHVITDLLEICKMDRQDWCFGTCHSNVKCGCFWGKPSTAGTFKKACNILGLEGGDASCPAQDATRWAPTNFRWGYFILINGQK